MNTFMNNKFYWGLGVLTILLIAITTVVVIRINNETQRLKDELAQLEAQIEAQKKAEKTPHAVDFSKTKPPDEPGFIWVRHGDHWDKIPIEQQQPQQDIPAEDVVHNVVEKPDYIYDPDREKPDGWKPELVYDIGDKKIDLNYRPLTEEEQAEYERLKEAKNLKTYNANIEASLRIIAIANVKEINKDKILSHLDLELATGRISGEEARKQMRDYYEFFAEGR